MQSELYKFVPELANMPEVNKISHQILSGEFNILPGQVFNNILNLVFKELQALSNYLVVFIALGMLTSVLNLLDDRKLTGTANASFFAVYAAVAAVGIKCYTVCLQYSSDVIGEMTDFVTKFSPILISLILASGKSITAAAFHPVLSVSVYIITVLCKNCIMPLASYSLILSVADNLDDKARVSGLCKLMSSVSKWILTLSFTMFTGICAIYGFSAPGLDALGAKTLKFAVGSLVPVVGGFLSETLETVITGSKLMKNTVGSAGLMVLCIITAVPVIKIGVMSFVVRISSAITEAISDKRISNLLFSISTAVTSLFGMVATVAVLYLINISIILAATS